MQNERTIDTPTGKVGYLTFNTHNNVAERQLAETMGRFQAAGISDLVLDVRYSGGGYLDVASELAYMIAGPQVTTGKTFEQVLANDKTRPAAPVPFHAQSQGFAGPNPLPKGTPLPSLGLKRVTLLTTGNTCSASEAIINGLRGVECSSPDRRHDVRQALRFLSHAQLRHHVFRRAVPGVTPRAWAIRRGMAPTCDVADDYQNPVGRPCRGMLRRRCATQQRQLYPATGASGC